jgi:hypothetical protein
MVGRPTPTPMDGRGHQGAGRALDGGSWRTPVTTLCVDGSGRPEAGRDGNGGRPPAPACGWCLPGRWRSGSPAVAMNGRPTRPVDGIARPAAAGNATRMKATRPTAPRVATMKIIKETNLTQLETSKKIKQIHDR